MPKAILRLGKIDIGYKPNDPKKFLDMFHMDLALNLKAKLKFRDEGNGLWRPFTEILGNSVHELQQFLKDAGFMPNFSVDGIYGYTTLSAVRLFQEYLRTIENKKSIGFPDGIAGPNTLKHIENWKAEKLNSSNYISNWGKSSTNNSSSDYDQWINVLKKAKNYYSSNQSSILALSENYSRPTDTKKIRDWDTGKNSIHLIGIRRNQDQSTSRRENDDLFVLLIRGMVFYFWGSTDPNPGMTSRTDTPFLIEGQHQYRFGWHKVSNEQRIYQALRPAKSGVLVLRDRDGDRAFTEQDLRTGIDQTPNQTINIHWSGIGRTNFSAGCQVIAGKSYINNLGTRIDCSSFASPSYTDLGKGKTRGAYNLLSDLILSYGPKGKYTINYTLARDETSFLSDQLTSEKISSLLDQLRS